MEDENTPALDALHPHGPEIPPVLDAEGACLVCRIIVDRDRAQERARLALRSLENARAALLHERNRADEAIEDARKAKGILETMRKFNRDCIENETRAKSEAEHWRREGALWKDQLNTALAQNQRLKSFITEFYGDVGAELVEAHEQIERLKRRLDDQNAGWKSIAEQARRDEREITLREASFFLRYEDWPEATAADAFDRKFRGAKAEGDSDG